MNEPTSPSPWGDLSPAQQRLWLAIRRHWREYRYAPTVRELASMLGHASPQAVWSTLHRLRKQGRVTWQRGASRTLQALGHWDDPDEEDLDDGTVDLDVDAEGVTP